MTNPINNYSVVKRTNQLMVFGSIALLLIANLAGIWFNSYQGWLESVILSWSIAAVVFFTIIATVSVFAVGIAYRNTRIGALENKAILVSITVSIWAVVTILFLFGLKWF